MGIVRHTLRVYMYIHVVVNTVHSCIFADTVEIEKSGLYTCPPIVLVYRRHRQMLASFPVPRPAFRRLQYGKAGRSWYISLLE